MTAQKVQNPSKLSTASDEIINSLTSVRSLCELLIDYPGMDDRHRIRFLSVIREETGRLAQLLGRLTTQPDLAGPL